MEEPFRLETNHRLGLRSEHEYIPTFVTTNARMYRTFASVELDGVKVNDTVSVFDLVFPYSLNIELCGVKSEYFLFRFLNKVYCHLRASATSMNY